MKYEWKMKKIPPRWFLIIFSIAVDIYMNIAVKSYMNIAVHIQMNIAVNMIAKSMKDMKFKL